MNENTNLLCSRSAKQTSPRAPTLASSIFHPCIVCSNFCSFFVVSYFHTSNTQTHQELVHWDITFVLLSLHSTPHTTQNECSVCSFHSYLLRENLHISRFVLTFLSSFSTNAKKKFVFTDEFFLQDEQNLGRNGVSVFTRTCNFLFIRWWVAASKRIQKTR